MIDTLEDCRGVDRPDVGSSENPMSHVISEIKLKVSDNLSLTQCNDGWWLYDYTRGMILSMRANRAQDFFVDSLVFYQRRLTEVESDLISLKTNVEAFVNQLHNCPDDEN